MIQVQTQRNEVKSKRFGSIVRAFYRFLSRKRYRFLVPGKLGQAASRIATFLLSSAAPWPKFHSSRLHRLLVTHFLYASLASTCPVSGRWACLGGSLIGPGVEKSPTSSTGRLELTRVESRTQGWWKKCVRATPGERVMHAGWRASLTLPPKGILVDRLAISKKILLSAHRLCQLHAHRFNASLGTDAGWFWFVNSASPWRCALSALLFFSFSACLLIFIYMLYRL